MMLSLPDSQCCDNGAGAGGVCDTKGAQLKAPTEMCQGGGGQAGMKPQCRSADVESEYSELEGIHRDH